MAVALPTAVNVMARLGRAALVLVVLGSTTQARALGWVLPAEGHDSSLAAIRAAVALSPEQTTVWSRYRFDGAARRVAIVFPLAAGSLVDAPPAGNSWLDALDSATAVRVLPPDEPLCAIDSSAVDGSMTHSAAAAELAPAEVAQLSSLAELDVFAGLRGLALDAASRSTLGASNGPYLALVYDLPDGSSETDAIRESSPAGTADRSLTPLDRSHSVTLTLSVLDVARSTVRGMDELTAADVAPHWLAASDRSDYPKRRSDLLSSGAGSRIVVEASSSVPLFGSQPIPSAHISIAPAVDTYVSLAARAGSISDPDGCLAMLGAARNTGAPLARVCAAGTLASVPNADGTTCVESWRSGEIDPGLVRCEAADDLALVFSGRRLDGIDVTRSAALLAGRTPSSLTFDPVAGETVSPVIRAVAVDGGTCSGGTVSGVDPGSTSGSGTTAGNGTSVVVIVDDTPDYGVDHSSGSCACGTSSSESDGCSSDTSSSSSEDCSGSTDSSSDGCSSDSSDSSSDGCSSNSSDSGSDGCSSNSSDSGDGCSGDSSGSDSGGADCSGSAESGADGCSGNGESGCSISGHRHPKFSLLTLIMSVIVLPIRRATSRRRKRRRILGREEEKLASSH